jgi:hypothetical protein
VRRPIGWSVTTTYCPDCVPEGLRDFYPPMREGDDRGVPYICDICNQQLKPTTEDNADGA